MLRVAVRQPYFSTRLSNSWFFFFFPSNSFNSISFQRSVADAVVVDFFVFGRWQSKGQMFFRFPWHERKPSIQFDSTVQWPSWHNVYLFVRRQRRLTKDGNIVVSELYWQSTALLLNDGHIKLSQIFSSISFQRSVADAVVVLDFVTFLIFFGFFSVRSSDFPASAFRCPLSTPQTVRLFVVLSPSHSDIFSEPSMRSPDLPEHLKSSLSISSICFGTPYPEKLMQLIFVCLNANPVTSHPSVFVGFVFPSGACRRKSSLHSASSVSSSIQKVIRSLLSDNPTRR